MDSETDAFNMDDFIKCALNSETQLEGGDCFSRNYLKNTPQAKIPKKTVSPENITDKSKNNLVDSLLTKNIFFNPTQKNSRYSERYYYKQGRSFLVQKIYNIVGDGDRAMNTEETIMANEFFKILDDVIREHSGLQLDQDFDDILKCLVHSSCDNDCIKYVTNDKTLTNPAKKIIREHNKFIKTEYPWYKYNHRNHYPDIRLKALHSIWKPKYDKHNKYAGEYVCTLSDKQISEIVKAINEVENS